MEIVEAQAQAEEMVGGVAVAVVLDGTLLVVISSSHYYLPLRLRCIVSNSGSSLISRRVKVKTGTNIKRTRRGTVQ